MMRSKAWVIRFKDNVMLEEEEEYMKRFNYTEFYVCILIDSTREICIEAKLEALQSTINTTWITLAYSLRKCIQS
jgi:hypothetical protein